MKILAVGAHPDDIELGCGASLARHRAMGDDVTLLVMTSGDRGPVMTRSRVYEQEAAAAIIGADLVWGHFPDGAVPSTGEAIDRVQKVIDELVPDLVYGHAPDDTHQDHRATAQATLAAGRRVPRLLLFETPSTLRFTPTMFVDVSGYMETKLAMLQAHESQVVLNSFVDPEVVEANSRVRGFQARVRQAEAFETTRFTWEPRPHQATEAAPAALRLAVG